jgi:hypothetical protein
LASLLVAAGDRRPVALHHLVGDAAPQHRPALVHEADEEGVCLVVGDSFLVVDAAVQGHVDAEGQESHAASLSHPLRAMERLAVAERVAEPTVMPKAGGRLALHAARPDGIY